MKKLLILLIMAVAVVSCGRSARVGGTLAQNGRHDTLYLQSVAPNRLAIVDSAIAKRGKFAFKVDLPQGEALFNVVGRGFTIPLAVAPGEQITLTGLSSRDYGVAGSPGSEQLRELALLMSGGAASLDSLNRLYMALEPADPAGEELVREYLKRFYAIKQAQIRFIVSNPGSLAALYGLYQRLPGDAVLFNNPASDVVYYRLVADSLAARDSLSAYLPALRADIARMEPLHEGDLPEIDYPEIELPDMYGKPAKLSSLEGKVILLDFWTATSPQSRLWNAELKERYAAWKERGLEIYQVGVDTDRALWVSTVQEQRLPWITLCDFRGDATPPVHAWNVSVLPTDFLIDRAGNVVARDLYGDALVARINELLR